MSTTKTPEEHADAFEDAAAALLASLKELHAGPIPHGLDPRAIMLGLSRGFESAIAAAGELARHGWFDADDPEIADRWQSALDGASTTAAMFEEVANGWI